MSILTRRSALILLIACLVGGLYVFLVPPWQHYDEPGNFEYAWLAAHSTRWPHTGEVNAGLRRQVAASMVEHGFFAAGAEPDLQSIEPVSIGISQLGDLPLYYFLVSLPLRAFPYADITFQLYLARLVSLFLFVLTIGFISGACHEILPPGHVLAWGVPLFVALLPPFVNQMTAVNNDVAATACGTCFLWGALRFLRRPLSLQTIAILLAATLLAAGSKSTSAVFAIPLFFLGIIWRALPTAKLRGLVFGLLALALPAVTFAWNQKSCAYVYAKSDADLPRQEASSIAPLGKMVYAVHGQEYEGNAFSLAIPPQSLEGLRGNTITLGVWAWSSQPVDIHPPQISYLYQAFEPSSATIHLDTVPQFFTFRWELRQDSLLTWIYVFPATNPQISVYWDGWTLATGDHRPDSPPVFSDATGSSGAWGGTAFTNLIRNASGEEGWPILRPTLGAALAKYFGLSSAFLWSWVDVSNMGWYYRSTLGQLFRSFWGIFAWGNVNLLGARPFRVFGALTILSAIGMGLSLWRARKSIPWDALFLLGFAVILCGLPTLFRGLGSWYVHLFIPSARYLFPVIFPLALVLCIGWHELYRRLPAHRLMARAAPWAGVFLLAAYQAWAVASIIRYFLTTLTMSQ